MLEGASPQPKEGHNLAPSSNDKEATLNKGTCLHSWKEIAAFLDRDPRTVQRWERTQALPVHRLQHSAKGSVYAFTADLEAWLVARTKIATPLEEYAAPLEPVKPVQYTRPQSINRHILLVPLFLLAFVIAFLVWQRLRHLIDRPAQAPFEPTLLTSGGGYEVSPSFSPDGYRILFASVGDDYRQFKLLIKGLADGVVRVLPLPGLSAFSPGWSPDGTRIAFLSSKSDSSPVDLWVTDLNSEKPIKLGTTWGDSSRFHSAVAWTPDSKNLVSVGREIPHEKSSGLFLYSLSGGARRQITNPPEGYSDIYPSVSPDGKTLIFTRLSKGSAALYKTSLENLNAVAAQLFAERFHNASSFVSCWDQNGHDIFFGMNVGATGQIWRARFSGNTVSDPVRLSSSSQNILSVARGRRNGELVYSVQQTDANLWQIDLRANAKTLKRAESILVSNRDELAVQYSPDGSQFAFESNRSGFWQIWVAQRNGVSGRPLTQFEGQVTGSPSWSPDSKMLAFDSRVNGKAEIFVIRAGGGKPRQLTNGNGPNLVPSWSRDGRWIYFASPSGGVTNIWKIHPDGSDRSQVTLHGGFRAQESVDGLYIYYTKSHGVITSVWRVPTGGGSEISQMTSVLDRNFAVGKSGIFYAALTDKLSSPTIYFRNFDSDTPSVVTKLVAPIAYGLALSPDEQELTFSQWDSKESDLQLVKGVY